MPSGPGPDAALLRVLDDVPPGPDLAATLAASWEADLGDHTLVEALAAWERLAAWAQAGSARVLGELLERTGGTSRHEFVADEVAARLGLTRHGAAQHVAVAHGASRLPEVADALAAGVVDRRKAEVLVSTGRLPDDVRRAAIRGLLPEAEQLTPPQLRERMRRAEIHEDPDGAAERHRAARAERSVRLEPVDDAMAYLTAYLPADDAARAYAAVDGVGAVMRRAPGEERGLDACRADALVGLLTGSVCTQVASTEECTNDAVVPGAVVPGAARSGGASSSAGSSGGSASAGRAGPGAVRVSVAASTLLGSDDLPGVLAGYGPIPAPMARALAGDPDAVWQRIFTDPGSGVLADLSSRRYRPSAALRAAVVARDATCTFPGCRIPASRCDLDHVVPYSDGEGPQTHGANLHALCRTHHRAKTHGGWQVARDPATGVTRWTAPTGHRHDRPPTVVDPVLARGRPSTDADPPF